MNFNDPMQTVIAGSKAAVDKACEVLKATGRQARAAAAGVGAVPFQPDEAGGRSAAGAAGRDQPSLRRRFRSSTTSTSRSKPIPTASATRWCARPSGPVRWVEMRAGHARRAASTPSSNAARARCWPAWPSASRPNSPAAARVRPGDAGGSCNGAELGMTAFHEHSEIRRPGCPGHRRLARHRRGDRARTGAARPQGHRHRHHRRGRGQDHRRARSTRRPGRDARRQRRRRRSRRWSTRSSRTYGGLHVLVNNAGITRDMLAMRLKDEDWDAVLDTNLKAVFRMSRAVMRTDDEAALRPHHQHHLRGRCLRQCRARPTTRPPRPAWPA